MQVTPSTFTVAEYCGQMESGAIVVNRDYQRSNKVWPSTAKSYLIDTILSGFPIPKLSLYQKLDIKSRKTLKEIVDGQQRSTTILSFFNNELAISGNTDWAGMRFDDLDGTMQARFLEYQLSTDIFVGATESEIRQVFRRINSYTIPLNAQEKRHASYQGKFKWFIVDLSDQYSQVLKDIGVFSERALSRMSDSSLFSEVVMAMYRGIENASETKLDNFYREHDEVFADQAEVEKRLEHGMSQLLEWVEIHKSALMKPYSFYSLLLAILHVQRPIDVLLDTWPGNADSNISLLENSLVVENLSILAAALEEPPQYPQLKEFVEANQAATNRIRTRSVRFGYYCQALTQG